MFDFLPKAFFCTGCKTPAWKTVCKNCKSSILTNSKLIPIPVHEIEAVAPLLYAFERTQSLIRHWKEHGGTDLRTLLFRMPENLRRTLLELHLFAIVPVPQSRPRSYSRGHESSLEVARFFSAQLKIPLLKLLDLNQEAPKRLTGLNRFEREFSENPFQISNRFLRDFSQIELLERKELRLLLVDDLITSGSTLSKAGETLKACFPKTKIWAGSLGFRPKLDQDWIRSAKGVQESRLIQDPKTLLLEPPSP